MARYLSLQGYGCRNSGHSNELLTTLGNFKVDQLKVHWKKGVNSTTIPLKEQFYLLNYYLMDNKRAITVSFGRQTCKVNGRHFDKFYWYIF